MNLTQVRYLIIDWGTTNFRAFAMSEQHQLLATQEANLGLLQVEQSRFAETLQSVLEPWLDNYQSLPIYMAGMVGSAKGWHDVPYAQTPVANAELVELAYSFDLPWGPKATIIPGVSHEYEPGLMDVMRGEEVQLFGLAKLIEQQEFTAILPGTHSKHASFVKGGIAAYESYLTGEFYSILFNHSILGQGLPTNTEYDEAAFLKGVKEGQSGALTNIVFFTRTHRLFAHLSEEQLPDYLSGLLIGYELRNLKQKQVYLVGGSGLCKRYQVAAESLGIQTTTYSGNDCFLAGMTDLIEELNRD